jgi:hypothetical protein
MPPAVADAPSAPRMMVKQDVDAVPLLYSARRMLLEYLREFLLMLLLLLLLALVLLLAVV